MQYIKNIWSDYYEVFKDVHKSARARPIKASLYGAATLIVLNLFRSNQDLRSYTAEVTSACTKLGAVVEESRNPISEDFVENVGQLNCNGLLRQLDLGFSTLIYKSDYNPELALYKSTCAYLQPSYLEIMRHRIVDFGLLGHWIVLERSMQDYDVNSYE